MKKVNEKLFWLGSICQEYRLKLNKTQKDVATELGCSVENISSFENGRNNNCRILIWYLSKGLSYNGKVGEIIWETFI